MKVTIRIHRQHDMDLMSIYRNKSYHLAKEFKKALVAYATGSHYTPPEVDFENEITGYVPTSAVLHVNLSEANEADRKAIELLSHIKHGYRCSFIKAVFRSSCVYLPLLAYSDESGFVMSSKIKVKSQIDPIITKTAEDKSKQEVPVVEVPVQKESAAEEPVEMKPTVFDSTPAPVFVPVPEPEPVSKDEPEPSDEEDLDRLFAQMDKMGR